MRLTTTGTDALGARPVALLEQGLARLDMRLNRAQVARLIDYLALLRRWNRAYNLTSVDTSEAMVRTHLLDSLSIAPFLAGERVLDVGTGAGLPGIPLAIAQPDRRFFLLDSNGKKIRFIRQVVIELALANVEPVHARLEDYRPAEPFARVVSRAFSSLEDFLQGARHLVAPGGQLLAMKGRWVASELTHIERTCVCRVERLQVPLLDAERHLVLIST